MACSFVLKRKTNPKIDQTSTITFTRIPDTHSFTFFTDKVIVLVLHIDLNSQIRSGIRGTRQNISQFNFVVVEEDLSALINSAGFEEAQA